MRPNRLPPLAAAALAAVFAAPGPVADGSDPKASPPAEAPLPPADAVFSAARAKLDGYATVRATLAETVAFGPAAFTAAGSFLRGEGGRVRLELTADAAGGNAAILQVGDGEVLHTQYAVGGTVKATRRNVRTLRRAAARLPDPGLAADLGLGGLSGLLASLQTGMKWRSPRRQTVRGRDFVVLDGRWTKRSRRRLYARYGADLPHFVPDGAKLYLDADRLFPHRFLYWAKDKTVEAGRRTLMTVDLSEVRVNGPAPAESFLYTLPADADEDDVTEIAVERLAEPAKPDDEDDDDDAGEPGDDA